MKNKKGFTLLELLIAATIVGALAVLATVSYKNSLVETRLQAAKARTEVLAGAVQRFRLDYGAGKLGSGLELRRLDTKGSCSPSNSVVSSLINCDYVENDGGWDDVYFKYFVCNGSKTADTPCANSSINNPLACMSGQSFQSKLPAKYKGTYAFCVSNIESGEHLGS